MTNKEQYANKEDKGNSIHHDTKILPKVAGCLILKNLSKMEGKYSLKSKICTLYEYYIRSVKVGIISLGQLWIDFKSLQV